jgi:hypothetical protein
VVVVGEEPASISGRRTFLADPRAGALSGFYSVTIVGFALSPDAGTVPGAM